MSKRQFKSQASSSRAGGGFGASTFVTTHSSFLLEYAQELPDFSSISDPHVVVIFKNLTKKDGTTKAKALEDLQLHLSTDVEIEDGFLEAWSQLFPRLSIDPVRRVRQLAFVFNGQVCSKCGRRTVKHLPQISGPWLSGTQDGDRGVARAAQDALNLVFPSPEKIQGVRKTFQRSILEFCRDAALHETVKTLSDERSVSKDDAAATYARVVSGGLAVIAIFIRDLDVEERVKCLDIHEEILSDSKLWDFATNDDPSVRRALHKLVHAYMSHIPDLVRNHEKLISTAYVYKSLPSDQTGSAIDFIQTLGLLTTELPTIWTGSYTAKKPAASRLSQFLKRGSQASSAAFWDYLSLLLVKIPETVFPSSSDELVELLSAGRTGVSKAEERFNARQAWSSYSTLVGIAAARVPETERDALLQDQLMPLVRQYVDPSPDTAEWNISGAKPAFTVSMVAKIQISHHLLLSQWSLLGARLIEVAKTSQPEQAKDFDKSQRHVAGFGERWANLQHAFLNGNYLFSKDSTGEFQKINNSILQECIGLLNARNGKPYGAAAILEELSRTCGKQLVKDEQFRNSYTTFMVNDSPNLIFSPSQRHLIHSLYAFNSEPFFSDAFKSLLEGVLNAEDSLDAKLTALQTMFSKSLPSEAINPSKVMQKFQEFVTTYLLSNRQMEAMSLFSDLVRLGVVTANTTDIVLSDLTSSLAISEKRPEGLVALDIIATANDTVIKEFMSQAGGAGEQLLPLVLQLEQSADEATAERAFTLASKLSSAMDDASSEARFAVVLQNLERVSASSLPIDSVFDLVERLMGQEKAVQSPEEILPNLLTWESALTSVMQAPKPSLASLSVLGGLVHFVQAADFDSLHPVQYDADGLSQALRIAMYVAKLAAETDILVKLDKTKAKVLLLLHISVLVAGDNVGVFGTNKMWKGSATVDAETSVLDFISNANDILRQYWNTLVPDPTAGTTSEYLQYLKSIEQIQQGQDLHGPEAYYTAVAYADTHANLFELHGHNTAQATRSEDDLRRIRTDKDVFKTVAFIIAFQQPLAGTNTLNRFCNELVADLTNSDASQQTSDALEKLVVLNTILRTQPDGEDTIAKQRIIFLVKHVLPWLEQEVPVSVKSETCRLLAILLPAMRDIYGEHWEQSIKFDINCWSSAALNNEIAVVDDNRILLVFSSFRLFAALRRLSKEEEPNDDLVEVLQENKNAIYTSLIQLLKSENGANDENHTPLSTMHEIMARQIAQLPPQAIEGLDDLYPLLYTPSRAVQQAAFGLLHQHIPAAQEQISFDAALENKVAKLPDELLSLLLETPTLDSLAEASFERNMPLTLQGYLSSWRLIFDHFDGSSYRVKNDYIEQLKEGAYLPGLLGLTFDFLGHTRGKPIDASRFDISTYTTDTEPSPERDVQWLLTHLYYLALTHVPSLAKSYFLDIRSRQTSLAVESWTAKYISPLVISASLQGVAEWAESSVKEEPEYERMTVKVGMRSKEINVGYLVDEQTMAIRVVLPEAYPLDSAKVLGVSRVAVKEEKWQSWLRNCQGVITFSNGSITDGLAAWRRNVTGTLKGQTECAICYSIISADKQLPTKRCPTCKHLFHSSCLFKWFKTSNANTCPLCRNAFQFN